MYDDKAGNFDDAFIYYFDVILKPFSKFMLKAIEKIKNLEIDTICPGHGPILRSSWRKYVEISAQRSEEYLKSTGENNIFIAYISAYGYTREMAFKIAEGLKKSGHANVDIVDIENIDVALLEEKIVRCKALMVGSPTINQNTLLPVYKLFSLINPMRDKGKLAAAFGSYGWSGEAVPLIENHLRNLKLDVAMDGISEKFFPNDEKGDRLIEFGKVFGEKLSLKKAEQIDQRS